MLKIDENKEKDYCKCGHHKSWHNEYFCEACNARCAFYPKEKVK